MKTTPPSILDLAPPPFEVVEIARGQIAVYSVSMANISDLLKSHPDISEAFSGRVSLKVSELATRFPDLAVDVAVAACRAQSDDEIAVIKTLDFGDIVDVVLTTVELSMPGGVQGFFDRFSARLPKVEKPEQAKPSAEKILLPLASSSKNGSVALSTRSQKRASASKR